MTANATSSSPNLPELLRRLLATQVELMVVGGTAAVMHGATTATFDLDVLFRFSRENCQRLLRALDGLHPRLSHTPDKRPLAYSAQELAGHKNLYLLTDLGKLDLLGSLPPIGDADSLLPLLEWQDHGGLKIPVVPLELLIQVKAAMDRPKDKQAEIELRAIAALRGIPREK